MNLLLTTTILALVGINIWTGADGFPSYYASEFHVAFLRQTNSDNLIEMIVLTKSSTPVQFNISSSTGFNHTGTTTSNAATFVTIPSNLQVRDSSYTYRDLGLHVTSSPSQPISLVLVGHISTPAMTYLALPCHDHFVDEYIYYGMSEATANSVRQGQILLVGCRDNTTVTITPTQTVQLPQDPQQSTSTTVTITAGTSHTITLHSLQTLLITALMVDLSGTKIVSNYPLTVVGGHECAQVPVNHDCDPMSTQVPPTINWGTDFLLTPLESSINGQRFKIIASKDDTTINIACLQNLTSSSTLALSGDIFTFDSEPNTYCHAVCSQPCYIAEVGFSQDFLETDFGDPLLMTVPPLRQYPHCVTFTTLPTMPTNFYSIALPADSYFNGTVIINSVLTELNWTSIYNSDGTISGYGFATAANGTYTISHSHPNSKIYVSVYGFSSNRGYGYVAGMLLKASKCNCR